jgi:glycosyltransferase involved in cell wall biosynthesis
VKDAYDRKHINWFYWQIGYEEASSVDYVASRHDVLFMGNGYSKPRMELGKLLRSSGLNVGLYGQWPPYYKPDGNTLYDFGRGAKLYQACKIAISDSQWPRATGFVSNRLFQAMAAGAFLLQQQFDGLTELLGLVPGVHLSTWIDNNDLASKLNYWMNNAAEREKIARAGQKYILENHSFAARVKELMRRLYV